MSMLKVNNNFNSEKSRAKNLETDTSKMDGHHNSSNKNGDKEKQAFGEIDKMRKRELFCDVTLILDNGFSIEAHRNILASRSSHFYEMFTKNNKNDEHRTKIHGIDFLTMNQLIDYIYTSNISINEENVLALHYAAKLLEITDVCNECCEFLQTQLKPYYCFAIRDFAEEYGYKELLSITNKYVEKNFREIVKWDEFLKFPVGRISKLISSDHIAVQSEEIIFESVISWVKFDLKGRKKYLAELIEHIQIPLLSRKYLIEHVVEEPLLKINMQCQQFIIKALKYQLLDDKQKILTLNSRTKVRQTRKTPKILFIVGGFYDSNDVSSGECFDFEQEKWYQSAELPTVKWGSKLAVVEERIYIVGGCDGKHVKVYDSFINQWTDCKSMIIPRMFFGIAVLNNCIYAVGGVVDGKSLKSAEIYNPKSNEWNMIPRMLKTRYRLGLGVINGFLYAVGGYNSDSKKSISSAECYDPKKGEWKLIASMSTPRYGFGVGVIDSVLYAVGGCDGKTVLRSVEFYNPDTNNWKLVAEMSECRNSAEVVVFNGMLYVVGGHNGTSDLKSIEVFSPAMNSWTTLPSSMTFPRRWAGGAIIDKLQAPLPLTYD